MALLLHTLSYLPAVRLSLQVSGSVLHTRLKPHGCDMINVYSAAGRL